MRSRVFVLSSPRARIGIAALGIVALVIAMATIAVYAVMVVLPPGWQVWGLIGLMLAMIPLGLSGSALLATRIKVSQEVVEVQGRGPLFGTQTLRRDQIISTEVEGDPVALTFVASDGTRLTVGPWEDPFPWSERVRKERLAQLQEALREKGER
jgi:hypothetical protein